MSRTRNFEIGIPTLDALPTIAPVVSEVVGVKLEPRESLHFGGEYFRGREANGREVYLYPNFDLLDDEPFYPDDSDCRFILRVDWSCTDPGVLLDALSVKLGVNCRVLRSA